MIEVSPENYLKLQYCKFSCSPYLRPYYKLYIEKNVDSKPRIDRYCNGFTINIQLTKEKGKVFIYYPPKYKSESLMNETTCSVEDSKLILSRMNNTNYPDYLQ
jgi:hypothetical protein